MAYIILLAGIPASGKTTFSGYLSKELGIPVLSKDRIKEVLYDSLGFRSREEKVKLGEASMNLMYGLAEERMKLGLPVILENNFETASKAKLTELIRSYGYRALTVYFEGDLKVIYERFLKRELSEERHLGHITNECYPPKEPFHREGKVNLDDFSRSVKERGMLDFDIGGEAVHVNTTDFGTIDRESVMEQIRKFIEVQAGPCRLREERKEYK